MISEIFVAFISGGLALIGVIISNRATENKIQQQILINRAVTDTKIDKLTQEVQKHNNFAVRMPVVESEIKHINDDIHTLKGYHT
jgi:hypothetical protein